jgi:hypothetical protein
VIVDKNFAASLAERPSAMSSSRHILKKPFTSLASCAGKSCEAAPSTVQGQVCPSESAVPRKAFVLHTRHSFHGKKWSSYFKRSRAVAGLQFKPELFLAIYEHAAWLSLSMSDLNSKSLKALSYFGRVYIDELSRREYPRQ